MESTGSVDSIGIELSKPRGATDQLKILSN